jgi:hypothetical protein
LSDSDASQAPDHQQAVMQFLKTSTVLGIHIKQGAPLTDLEEGMLINAMGLLRLALERRPRSTGAPRQET